MLINQSVNIYISLLDALKFTAMSGSFLQCKTTLHQEAPHLLRRSFEMAGMLGLDLSRDPEKQRNSIISYAWKQEKSNLC